jgi:hypothetical protein
MQLKPNMKVLSLNARSKAAGRYSQYPMKFICILLFVTFQFVLRAQNQNIVAVINGQYEGSITKKALMKSKHIEVYPKNKDFKIINFIFFTNNNGDLDEMSINSRQFDEKFKSKFNYLSQGDDLYFWHINAINKKTGDTLGLNSIHFIIGQDQKKEKKINDRLNFIFKVQNKRVVEISKENILKIDSLVLLKSEIRVISFIVEYYYNGVKQQLFNNTYKFSSEIKNKIDKELRKGSRLIIKEIIGTDYANRKYFIAPEIIKII